MKIVTENKIIPSNYSNSIKHQETSIILNEEELRYIIEDIQKAIDYIFDERRDSNGEIEIDGIVDEIFEIIDRQIYFYFPKQNSFVF